jgi:hypothetical protein
MYISGFILNIICLLSTLTIMITGSVILNNNNNYDTTNKSIYHTYFWCVLYITANAIYTGFLVYYILKYVINFCIQRTIIYENTLFNDLFGIVFSIIYYTCSFILVVYGIYVYNELDSNIDYNLVIYFSVNFWFIMFNVITFTCIYISLIIYPCITTRT